METDQVLSGDCPQAPPLIPPPVPPPIAWPPLAVEETPTAIWRWNDRLAIVAGGLTLLLIGVFAGRMFGPASSAPGPQQGELVASTDVGGDSSAPATALPVSTSQEVNPPELIVTPLPCVPTLDESTPVLEAAVVQVASATTSEVPAAQTTVPLPAAPPVERAEETSAGENSVAAEETPPTSVEGTVATIRLPPLAPACAAEKKFKDRKLNTALDWAESTSAAAQQAEDEQKLVFLIHVSGNFEMPGFT